MVGTGERDGRKKNLFCLLGIGRVVENEPEAHIELVLNLLAVLEVLDRVLLELLLCLLRVCVC